MWVLRDSARNNRPRKHVKSYSFHECERVLGYLLNPESLKKSDTIILDDPVFSA